VLNHKIDAPYSCQGGVCSSCIARITQGKAEMVKNQILTDGEVAEGLILTCQAHPLTPDLRVDYDDVGSSMGGGASRNNSMARRTWSSPMVKVFSIALLASVPNFSRPLGSMKSALV